MFTRILVATDFSAPSQAALTYARGVAAKFGAPIHVLHVVEDEFVAGPLGAEMYAPPATVSLQNLIAEAQARLRTIPTPEEAATRRLTTEVIVGKAARTIADYADDNEYDLIVMGTHGRTGLAHVLMGSVAEHVVRTALCPVLTVHAAPATTRLPVMVRRAAMA
jgi:universal stress protein A